jgi:trimethylamine corrinoid protein
MGGNRERILLEAKEAILQGNRKKAEAIGRAALAEGLDPSDLMHQGFIAGINEVGEQFGSGKLFLPDLILAGEAMKAAIEICGAALPLGKVHDLGRDVPTAKFIEQAQERNVDVIGTSCLLTTTMEMQKKLEQELGKAGLRERYKTIIGGAPVTQRWASRIGADAYAEDGIDAVKKIRKLLDH